jgi:hypothetical protein
MTMSAPLQLDLEDMISSQPDTLVSHFRRPGTGTAQKMTAISGHRLVGSWLSAGPVGSLERMLLVTSPWASTTCYLTWKAKATPQGRLLLELAPSMPRTGDLASGLWPTPAAWDGQRGARKPDGKRGMALSDLTKAHLWPTPAARDYKGANSEEHLSKARGHHDQLPNAVKMAGHQDGSLNPPWVEWLMGYPVGWTDLKVLGTASSLKSSKKSEEQSSVPIND